MIWNPDCKDDPCDCPGGPIPGEYREEVQAHEPVQPAVITLGDIHKALQALTARGATLASIQWVMDNQMPVDPVPDCPEHKLVQHRDMKRPWCNECGRDALGAVIGRPKPRVWSKRDADGNFLPRHLQPIQRETIEQALSNDRCGECGSVDHFTEDHFAGGHGG